MVTWMQKETPYYGASPVLDKANLDFENTDPANMDFNLEQARFHFPYLERTSPAAFTFVVNTHLPDSTFIFPIAADALLVIKNYLHNSTLYEISYVMVKLIQNPLSGEDTTVDLQSGAIWQHHYHLQAKPDRADSSLLQLWPRGNKSFLQASFGGGGQL